MRRGRGCRPGRTSSCRGCRETPRFLSGRAAGTPWSPRARYIPQADLRKSACERATLNAVRDGAPGDVRRIDDVRALAALGHPDRVRLMDALAVHGPSTTTMLAQSLGL